MRIAVISDMHGNDLAFEAAATALCVDRDLVAQRGRKSNGSGNGCVQGCSGASHTEKVPHGLAAQVER